MTKLNLKIRTEVLPFRHLLKQSRKREKKWQYWRELLPVYLIKQGVTYLIILWGAIAAFGQVDIYKGTPFVDNYSIVDYRAGPVNWAISEDQNGILYFANKQGLLKYDGTAWELFRVKHGLYLMSVLVDEEKIYVGTQEEFGYFESRETGRLVYHSLSDKLDEAYGFKEIVKIHAVNNLIYFFSYTHTFVFDGQSLRTINLPNSVSAAKVKNGLAISIKGEGLSILNNDGLTMLSTDDALIDNALVKIISTSKNCMLLFSIENGIYVLQNGKVSPWKFSHPEILKRVKISDVIETKDGKYLIGTEASGVLEVDKTGHLLNIYNKDNGLANNVIYSLFEDNYGSVWLTHSHGISKIDYNSPFTKIDDNLGIEGAGKSVVKYKEELYVGTKLGLFKYNSRNNSYEFVPNSEGKVLSLVQIDNRLFVGHHTGVFVYDEGKLEKISDWMGCWNIMSVPDYDDKITLGGYHGIQILNIDKENKFDISDIDYKGTIWDMEFDQDGYLWATNGQEGISRFKIDFRNDTLEEVKFYDGNGVFSSPNYIYIYTIDNETLFAGYGGIFQFNHSNQQFEAAEKFGDYFSSNLKIKELEEDHLGNIYYWTPSESGLITNPGKSSQKIIKKPFHQLMHIVNTGEIDYDFLDEHNLFLDANEGFIHLNPHQITEKTDSFKLYIRQIDMIGEKDSMIYKHDFGKPVKEKITIPARSNALRFSSSAVFYTENERMEYSYFIENFDKTWSPWTDKSEKEYINLPPGNYQFMVKAKNVFQIESNTASFAFRILPPWYRTTLAYLLYAIVVLVLFCLWYFDLLRRHTAEKDIIKSESRKEIDESKSQVEEIYRKKTEEIMQLENEKLEAEVNYKNQELASTTLHLINKNQLLSDIRRNLTISQNSDDPDIQSIIGKIDKDIKQDSNWEMFEIHFDRVHVDFIKRLKEKHKDLSPQDVKIAAYSRMNLSSKEMAELLNISLNGVEKARYRLRKKINLERNDSLTEYISKI